MFGPVLASARKKRGLSQSMLAQLAGVTASYVNRIETGKRNPPSPEIVVAFAKALDMTGEETDQLLQSAGYTRAKLNRRGKRVEQLAAVASTLQTSSPREVIRPKQPSEIEELSQQLEQALVTVSKVPLKPSDREIIVGMMRPMVSYARDVAQYVATLSRQSYPSRWGAAGDKADVDTPSMATTIGIDAESGALASDEHMREENTMRTYASSQDPTFQPTLQWVEKILAESPVYEGPPGT